MFGGSGTTESGADAEFWSDNYRNVIVYRVQIH
jgi:hypothetical protein